VLKTPRAALNKSFIVLACALFVAYMPAALPLAVLPVYVRHVLGFSDAAAGVVIGAQFAVTIGLRNYIGIFTDRAGGRRGTLSGMFICIISGACFLPAHFFSSSPYIALSILLLGRALLGLGQGTLLNGNVLWGLGFMGVENSGRVMGINGMAIYLALALAAPLGLLVSNWGGLPALGLTSMGLSGLSLLLDWQLRATPILGGGPRLPFSGVVRLVWKYGLCLGLHGVGFAVISAFSALYFLSKDWEGAGMGLTCFGLAFAAARFFFNQAPDRWGGVVVSRISILIETTGLFVIWLAPAPALALAGFVLTGLGCSLIFPGLGAEAVKLAPTNMRATTVGIYAAFQDLAYIAAAPLLGLLAPWGGYEAMFLTAGLCAALAFALMTVFFRTSRRSPVLE
jgi:MFS family permease